MVESKNIFIRALHPLFVICAYLFLYIPVFVLIFFSFSSASLLAVKWAGFSLKWYKNIFIYPEILKALNVSLIVAFVSTILSIAMGTAFVFATKWWKSAILDKIFYANVILPDIILAVGLLSLFAFFQVPLGYVTLIAGHTLIGLGFVIPIVRSRFKEIDPILTEASSDLGATQAETFWKIILPLLTPSIVASSLLVFTLSLDDFFIAYFCSGAKIQTLSIYVFSKIREGLDPTINALSTCMLAISSLFVIILSLLKVVDRVIGHE
ncbi:ABC transporter permease [Candidatus Babeliales bacterium]|nr:ABC transporter permease [Candidatus Babeliales bacterium]